jgi:hypothetical protein
MPATVTQRGPRRSASGPLTAPREKYKNPLRAKTNEISPRVAAKVCCKAGKKEEKVYATPKPNSDTKNAPTTTTHPEKRRDTGRTGLNSVEMCLIE